MNIILLTIAMNNFKKQKDTTINFANRTYMIGDNESGKTSVYDAWLWLLFDRDSRGNKGASAAKTTDGAVFLHHLDHEVAADIIIDGTPVKLKKILREKWVKPQSKPDARFDGNQTFFWKDEVEMTVGQFADWIKSLGPVPLLQCLTDLKYFSEDLTWRERLSYLMDMSGGITNEEVAQGDKDLDNLLIKMGDKSLADFKKMTQAQISLIKDELAKLPIRINEQRNMISDIDYDAVEAELKLKQKELKIFTDMETDISKAMEPVFALNRQLADLQGKRYSLPQKLANDVNTESRSRQGIVNSLTSEHINLENSIWNAKAKSDTYRTHISNLEKSTTNMRVEAARHIDMLKQVRTAVMNDIPDSEFECPTCHQPLPESDQELKNNELIDSFEFSRKQRISELESIIENLRALGTQNNEKVIAINSDLDANETLLDKLKAEMSALNLKILEADENLSGTKIYSASDFATHPEVLKLDDEIKMLEAQIECYEIPSVAENAACKDEIIREIDSLKTRLYRREVNNNALSKIKQYEADMKTNGINQATLEGLVYQCDRFVVVRTTKMENRINSMFSMVTFKLFKEQINGGIEETCEAIVNGTTFHDANTAGQINAGLDIIGTLMSHYGMNLPVFVDNVNLVTKPRQLDTQMIHMVVREGMPLTVEHNI